MAITLNGTTGITTPDVDSTNDSTINGVTVGRGAGSVASNTAVGASALAGSNSGSGFNVGVGYQSLFSNTTGERNSSVGVAAMYLNTTGSYNTVQGMYALYSNTTASNNTAVGYQAGYNNQTAGANTYIGHQAGYLANRGTTSNVLNTFVGHQAGYNVTTGYKNTILGSYNGNQGGLDIRTANNYIVLSDGDGNPRVVVDGNGANYFNCSTSPTANGTGTGGLNTLVTAGDAFNLKHTVNGATVINLWQTGTTTTTALNFYKGNTQTSVGSISMSTTAVSYNTSSDYRLKENVVGVTGAAARVQQLNPVRFNFIADPDTTVDGFLAHEVQDVVPEAISGTKDAVDAEGNPVYQGIDQSKLVPLLTAALQEALTKIDSLETRIAALEGN